MSNLANTIVEQFGLYGILLIAISILGYLIWGDRKNNWGQKIKNLEENVNYMGNQLEKIQDSLDKKTDKLESNIYHLEDNIKHLIREHSNPGIKEVRIETNNIMTSGKGGKISKILREYCSKINCDHIFLGSFHNSITDLRGIHYCKFDIIIDEYRDPLRLHPNDNDFRLLYKDENIMTYGDLPYACAKTNGVIIKVDDDQHTLLELSNTVYRRCSGREIKYIGFVPIKNESDDIIGFIGCISYSGEPVESELKNCSKLVELIYN